MVQWSRIQSSKYFLGAQYGTMVEDSVKEIFSRSAVWYNGQEFSQGNIFSECSKVQLSRIQSRKYFLGAQYGTMVKNSVKEIFSRSAVWYNGREFSQGSAG